MYAFSNKWGKSIDIWKLNKVVEQKNVQKSSIHLRTRILFRVTAASLSLSQHAVEETVLVACLSQGSNVDGGTNSHLYSHLRAI